MMVGGKRIAAAAAALLLAVSAFTGCGNNGDVTSGATQQEYPVTVNGVTVQQEPVGVAVLSGNVADAILAMDYEISLKAKTADCTQPELEALPVVEPGDAGAIQAAGADVALTGTALPEDQAAALSGAGITVVTVAPAETRSDLQRMYGEIGAVLHGGQTGYTHGAESAQNVFYTLDDIARAIPESNMPVTGCWLTDAAGGGVTGDQFLSALLELSGLSNVGAGCTGGSLPLETLAIEDPQYIFCTEGVKAQLESTPGYQDLTAVREGRVYEMPASYLAWQGRTLVQAAVFIAGTVYPELASTEPVESEPAPESGVSSAGGSGASSGAPSGETLQIGDTGDAVLALQQRLDELGYMFLPCTGEFGEGTQQAVEDFQYLNGMVCTGIADPETQARIYSDSAVPRTD